jgi:hypothetical protein
MRLLITLLAPLIAWAVGFLRLPGLADFPMPRGSSAESVSIVALGLLPALSGYVTVELVAAAVPRWRTLRTGGPVERLKLRRASLALTMVLAVVQAYFISRWLASNPWFTVEVSPLVIIATLVGGTGFLLALAWLVDRWGLTSGFSALLVLPSAQELWRLLWLRPEEDVLTPFALVLVAAIFLGFAGATVWILTKPSQQRLPVCGLVPLPVAHGFLVAAGWAGMYLHFVVPSQASLPGALLYVALVALQGLAYGRRFARPAARFGLTDVGADVRVSIFYVVWMSLPWLLLLKIPVAVDAFAVATGVAVVLDLAAELRARRKEPTLVDVWPLHEVALVGPALAALEKAGIFAHARAVHHRSLLQLFGPFVPIDLYVPAARAEEAQEILADTLLEADSTK